MMPVSHGDGGKWERLSKRERHVVLEPVLQTDQRQVGAGEPVTPTRPADCNSQDIGVRLDNVFE